MSKSNIEDIYPLSPLQQGMLFHSLYDSNAAMYFDQTAYTLRGELDVAAFKQAWQQAVDRHTILRTLFRWKVRNDPLQIVCKQANPLWTERDWRHLPQLEQEEQLGIFLKADEGRRFDLSQAPLMRFALIKVADSAYYFVWSRHHLLLDRWSSAELLKEVSAFYKAFCQGQEPDLEPSRPYRHYIAWLGQQDLTKAETFWRSTLKGFTKPTALGKNQRPGVLPHQEIIRDSQKLSLPVSLTAALQSLAIRNRLTMNTLVQGAWAQLLSRYSGEEDVLFGATVSGRPADLPGVESMVGLFINTLALRVQVTPGEMLLPWLKRLQGHMVELRQYEYSPLVQVQGWSEVPRGLPLFESIFVFENIPMPLPLQELDGGLEIGSVRSGGGGTNYPLSVIALPGPELVLRIIYDCNRFDAPGITWMLGHFKTLLQEMVANPERLLSNLPMLTEAERQQVLVEWNNTKTDYASGKCIHELFEAQVERTPDALAVVFEDRQLTYRELNAKANQLAHYLKKRGVGPEVLVGVCVERSVEMVVALLAIVKGGGAYVPLDPQYPKERLKFMLEDTRASIIVTQRRLRDRLPSHEATVVYLDEEAAWATELDENPVAAIRPENLLYVMYTSGSTGTPKGVSVVHRGVVRLVKNTDYAELTSDEVFLQFAPISFDAATFEIWGALLHGARCVLFPGSLSTPKELGEILHRHSVSTLWLTASLFNAIVDEAPEVLANVRQLLIGGEALSVPHVRRALTLLPGAQIINGYGPTESTTFTCCYPVPRDLSGIQSSIPIGRPIANTQVFVLDRHLRPVPVGVAGELCIGGDGLARGYLNRPELTAEKFTPNPFSSEPGARLYGTGDLVRYRPDGNIEFLGRTDHQVKIRGFRIELGEIETLLLQQPAVRQALVVVREDSEDSTERKRLAAYVVAKNAALTAQALGAFLRERLPEYMVPSDFVFLSALPLTPNGKVDRERLPVLNPSGHENGRMFSAPRDNVEHRLAKIWEDILGVRPVGVNDNFFELGGHSLLAVRLMARVEKEFNRSVPLAALFQAPTIEQLASTLHSQESSPPWSRLVPFQMGGSKPPFFCLHGAGEDLTKLLGMDQPFYGFQAHGQDGRQAPSKVEDMAADYIKEIQTIQPKGPYYLGGYSFGGMVVFEVAQQLHKQGEEVALLALLDPTKPIYRKLASLDSASSPPPLSNIILLRDEARQHLRSLALLAFREQLAYLWQRVRWRIEGIKKELKMIACRFYLAVGRRVPFNLSMFYFFEISYQAARTYTPQVYTGSMILFRTQTPSYDSRLDWPRLAAGGLEIHQIPGKHFEILKEPYVQVLAEHLKECLNGAQTTKSFRQT